MHGTHKTKKHFKESVVIVKRKIKLHDEVEKRVMTPTADNSRQTIISILK